MLKKFTFLTLLLLPFFAIGQSADFPSNPDEFFPVFKKFMQEGESKEMKDFLEEFELVWNDGPFGIYHDQVISYSNELQKKRLRANPHFKAYIRAVMDFHKSGQPKSNFDEWMKGLEWMLKKKSSSYLVEYLGLSSDLFTYNALYKTAGHMWYSENADYKITFKDNNEIQILYPNTTLKCEGKDDSTAIESTSGVYYPLEEKFVGSKGSVYWDRVKHPRNEVYANLNNYQINIKRATFEADSVDFYHVKYFKAPLKGHLEDKLTDQMEHRVSSYPKFDSYTKRFEIKNVFEDITYEGGFSYYGNRFLAKGDSANLAYVRVYRDGQVFIKAASKNFSIEEAKLTSARAAVTIYMAEDSIYHPGLEFKFLNDTNEISFLRVGEGTVETPFLDSYHQIELYFEALTWQRKEKLMRVSSSKGSERNQARFRSERFFNEVEYQKIQGMDDIHPVVRLGNFLRDKNNNAASFKAVDFAKYIRLDLSQTRQMLMNFSIAGLITYNIDTELATVTEKFFHTLNSARRTTDYDVIEIYSEMPRGKPNALLSLVDYRLDIKGVDNVVISDSQKVEIYPYADQLTLKKGMDFSFNGRIFAGRFGVYGTSFDFFYKDFKFVLQDVDSVKIIASTYEKNMYGLYADTILNSVIEDLNGELLIDHPNNKSGLKSFPEFPSLISNKKSYVYYDAPYIEKGVYKRNRFFFMLDPFKKDTLDEFHTSSLNFDGTFVSDGIFPDLREKLIIMPDYALGFFKVTESTGLPAYSGKGTYYDTLTLSNRGLRGAGQIEYLTSQAWSRDFIFYPDSMNAHAHRFGIKKTKGKIETPDVKATNVQVHWEPDNDKFRVKESGSPFEMYDKQSLMTGTLTLTSLGLEGDGLMSFGNAELNSNQFRYKSDDFKSDTSSFQLKDIVSASGEGDTSQVAFKTDNVKADVTFTGRKGSFKSNRPDSYVEFPINKFKAYMEEMEWYMDKQEVDLNSRKVDEIGLKGALFVSTDPRLDSLSFVAPQAKFVLEGKEINCTGVKYLEVADSRIFPVDETVIIRKAAKIDPFINAKIWVGKDDKIHILENANVTVFTSHKYSGTADYNFVDEVGKAQVIRFNKVDVDEKDVTIAEGIIEQVVDFTLSPNFGFKGKVNLYGKNRFLTFDGYFKVAHLCPNMKHDWVKFNTEIDPNNIMIPVPKEPENDQQNKTFNGFLFASDSTGIYPAMFSPKIRYSDYEVLNVFGYLSFDKKTQEFRISRKEKLTDRDLPGNYLAFNTSTCSAYGEGQMELGSKLGQVDLKCAGSVMHEPKENNISMDIVLTMNFKLEQSMMKFIEDKVKAVPETGADITEDKNRRAITDLLDSGKADKIYNDLTAEGKFKRLPKELNKTLVLTDLHLVWDKTDRSLLHNGTVGVMVLNGEQVNKQATALVELNRKASGDIITIYLEFDEQHWYFFSYRNNMMSVYSGMKEFNELMNSLDMGKRQFQQEGLPVYQFTPATQRRVDKFKEKFGITTGN